MTADPYGWTDRSGILWRSKESKVIVSSEPRCYDKPYRIVVNDEVEMHEALVLKATDDDWLEIVLDAIKFAEGYAMKMSKES